MPYPYKYDLEVSSGNIPNVSHVSKFGFNSDVDTGSAETVWSFGGLWSPLYSGETMDVVSSSTADTSDGTGARTVRLFGLDSNWELTTEDVVLNGTTDVRTTTSFISIYRVLVTTSGTGGTNAGNILVTASTAATVQAQVPVGFGITHQLIYTIPANYTAYLSRVQISATKVSGSQPVVTLQGVITDSAGNQRISLEDVFDTNVNNEVIIENTVANPIAQKTHLQIRASSDTANTIIHGRVSLYLRKNNT